MTATAATKASDGRPGARRPRSVGLVPVAEVALCVLTLTTVAGMWRLFDDGSYFGPLAVHAVAAHVLAAGLRRNGVPTPVAALVLAVAATLAITWGHLGHTATLGVPTGRTFDVAWDELEAAWALFHDVRAPAPVVPGFLIAAGAAVWAAAFLADVAAFRLWATFEPLVPSATIFVFASFVAADRGRTGATAAWLAAALAFALLHRTSTQHASPSWLGSDPRLGTLSLLKAGSVLLVAAVAVGWVVAPRLPGAGAEPVVDLDDLTDDADEPRQTISPLVQIQRQLVQQSNVELFTVRSTQRSYWRLTALDEFDGSVWSSEGSFGSADGDLDDLDDPPPGAVAVEQSFAVSGLSAIWLPAAFEPRRLDAGDAEVRWEAESSTLIVPTDVPTSDGLTYRVTSAVPAALTGEALASLTGDTPDRVLDTNLALPGDFPATIAAEAQRVVADAGATTPYAQAMALQSYFRDGSFTYSLEAPHSHSQDTMASFLFETREGYCEQFAGTYAAMARAVGLPARVAVGFTPGEPDPVEPDVYRVRGEHAHAWPEVWIPGAGWLAFEPTPGRGAPGAGYTGVPEAQATSGDPTSATTATTAPGPAATTPAGEPGASTTAPAGAPPPIGDEGGGSSGGGVAEGDDGAGVGRVALVVAVVLGGLLVLAGLVGAGVAAARRIRRWRRWATAATAGARVHAAWADAVEAVGIVGLSPRRHETPVEFAGRAGRVLGDDEMAPLAWLVAAADYAPGEVPDDDAESARARSAAVRRAVVASTTPWERILAAVDPRPPARRRRGGAAPGAGRPGGGQPRLQVTRIGS